MRRRSFLNGAAALPLLHLAAKPVMAQVHLGEATLTTVSDGNLVLPGSFVFDPMPKAPLAQILKTKGISSEQLTPECNLALYQDADRNVLFDVGSGPDFMPSAGKIVDSLDGLGLTPEDITHVVFTHAHPDHIWGLLDDFGDLLFYEADYMIGRTEWAYWWDPETVNTISDSRAAFAVGARRRLEVIQDSITFFDDGDEILPGIAAVASFGHTPGHMAFEVRQGTDSVLVLGDAIGNHHIAFARPDWESGADHDMTRAVATRKRLFDRITSEQMQILGFHMPDGGIGRIDTDGDGYRFVAGG